MGKIEEGETIGLMSGNGRADQQLLPVETRESFSAIESDPSIPVCIVVPRSVELRATIRR